MVNEINKVKEAKVETVNNPSFADKKVKTVEKEIIVYTEEKYLESASSKVADLYYEVKNRILELEDVRMEPKKMYIAFKCKTNICDLTLFQNSLKIFINMRKGTLKDPENLTEDIANKGHWGNGDYQVIIKNDNFIDELMDLIKQSYRHNKQTD